MTYNINDATSYNSFKDITFEIAFVEIKSMADIEKAVKTGEHFDKFQSVLAGHRDQLTYLDIAHVVHAVREMLAETALAPLIRERCTKENISIWQEGKDAAKDKPANVFQPYVTLLRGNVKDGNKVLSSSWKNLLRVVRHLVEEKVPVGNIVSFIETATVTQDGKTYTKLEALRFKDRANHASTTKGSKSFQESKPFEKAGKAKSVGMVSGLTTTLTSHDGYSVVLIRKGENDNFDVVGEFGDDVTVKMAIRKIFG